MIFLLAIAAGLLDMIRGGLWSNKLHKGINKVRKPICMTALACIIASQLPASPLVLMFVVWFGLLGWRAGTGDPMGKMVRGHQPYKLTEENLEKWQWTDNAWWSAATLGVIWTLPCIALGFIVSPSWFLVSALYAVSFPLAGIIGRKLPEEWNKWMWIEGFRSAIAIASLITITNI